MSRRTKSLALLTGLTVSAGVAYADVTVVSSMKSEGAGAFSVAAVTGTTTEIISGNRARMESEIKFNTGMMNMFAKFAPGAMVDIVNLDQDRIYNVDVKKKQYTETSFADLRAQMQQAMAQLEAASGGGGIPSAVDDSQCDWSKSRADIKKGSKATIAGFDTQQHTITATQTCTDRKTKQTCDVGLVFDLWVAPKVPGADEQNKYYMAYAQKMGLTTGMNKDLYQRAETMFARYKGVWGDVMTKMISVKGHPLRSSIGLTAGGPGCATAGAAANTPAGGMPGAAGGQGADSTGSIGGEIAKEVVKQKAMEKTGNPIIGELGGKLMGGIMKLGKKKDQPAEQPAADAGAATATATPAPSGSTYIMKVTTEVTSISMSAAPAGSFDVPAGFKLVAPKGKK